MFVVATTRKDEKKNGIDIFVISRCLCTKTVFNAICLPLFYTGKKVNFYTVFSYDMVS